MATTKTYTREVYRFFTREELQELLKRAHAECKKEVPLTVHQIGVKRKRTVMMRKREDYKNCIRKKILEELKRKIPEGVKIELPI
jgi:hypothetical protein